MRESNIREKSERAACKRRERKRGRERVSNLREKLVRGYIL